MGFELPFSSNPKPSGWLVLGRAGLTGPPALSVEGGAGRFAYSYTSGRLWRVGARLGYGAGFVFATAVHSRDPRLPHTPAPPPRAART